MIQVIYLCAIMLDGGSCFPFTTMNACLTAEEHLDVRLVELSECNQIERLLSGSIGDNIPVPRARPSTQ